MASINEISKVLDPRLAELENYLVPEKFYIFLIWFKSYLNRVSLKLFWKNYIFHVLLLLESIDSESWAYFIHFLMFDSEKIPSGRTTWIQWTQSNWKRTRKGTWSFEFSLLVLSLFRSLQIMKIYQKKWMRKLTHF